MCWGPFCAATFYPSEHFWVIWPFHTWRNWGTVLSGHLKVRELMSSLPEIQTQTECCRDGTLSWDKQDVAEEEGEFPESPHSSLVKSVILPIIKRIALLLKTQSFGYSLVPETQNRELEGPLEDLVNLFPFFILEESEAPTSDSLLQS